MLTFQITFQITFTLLLATVCASIGIQPIAEHQRGQTPSELSSQPTISEVGTAPKSCPVTRPPRQSFVPPSPYPNQNSHDRFWFGDGKLWIQLPIDGTWKYLSHYKPTDTGFSEKLQWWRQGYNWRTENPPQLTVTGKRLDSPAAPLATDGHANAAGMGDHPSMMTGIFIPTVGCWQITGDYKGDKLTFVIWVEQ